VTVLPHRIHIAAPVNDHNNEAQRAAAASRHPAYVQRFEDTLAAANGDPRALAPGIIAAAEWVPSRGVEANAV
jgi:hypothetical protein